MNKIASSSYLSKTLFTSRILSSERKNHCEYAETKKSDYLREYPIIVISVTLSLAKEQMFLTAYGFWNKNS